MGSQTEDTNQKNIIEELTSSLNTFKKSNESMRNCLNQVYSLTLAPEEILYNEDLRKQLKEIHRLTKIELEKK